MQHVLNGIFNIVKTPLSNLTLRLDFWTIGQFIFILLILLYSYKRLIKGTQAEKIVKGLFILIFMWGFSELLIKLDVQIIGVFLKTLTSIILLSLVIIFQPELRRFLAYLGQSDFISRTLFKTKNGNNIDDINTVQELIEAVKYFSKTRHGCLIVLQKDARNNLYSEVGTKINADLSSELLITIFHPNTPLHDGAVIVCNNKILAAGVLLPLTADPKLSWRYGTRHRAAIGMSEVSDSACLVVSEETGEVSIAIDGILKKYDDISALRVDLENILSYSNVESCDEKSIMFNLIKIKKKQK